MLEDSVADTEIIQRLLRKENVVADYHVAANKKAYVQALNEFNPDVILADNSLYQFDAMEALDTCRIKCIDIPFILVTGTVSDEFAASIIKKGADDYILKDRLTRLPAAIEGALKQRKAEREKREAWEKLMQMNTRLRELSGHLQTIREEERKQISRDIHDQLGQQLTIIKMDIIELSKKLAGGGKEIEERVDNIGYVVDETIKMIRKIAHELRPTLLDHMGLAPAIEWHLKEFEKRSGIYTTFTSNIREVSLDDKVKINLFRIMQESLTNIGRHALARSIIVKLEQQNDEVTLLIQDDGIGFNVKEVTAKETFGILGMKERMAMIGGACTIYSLPGNGTTITVKVKLKATVKPGNAENPA